MRTTAAQLRIWLLGLFLFLLPWQTRWILFRAEIGGAVWEYGTLALYVTEILLWIIALTGWKDLIHRFARSGEWKWLMVIGVALLFFFAAEAREPAVAFFAALHIFEAIILIAVMASAPRRVFLWLGASFVAGAAAQSFLAIFQVAAQWVHPSTILGIAGHDPFVAGTAVVETATGRFLRAYGGLPHPNILGGYLAVAMLTLVAFIREARSRMGWLITVFAAAIILGALFLTFSRSAWIALVVSVLMVVFVLRARAREEIREPVVRWRAVSLIFVALSILTVLIFTFRDVVAVRFNGDGRLEYISREERFGGVRDAWGLIRERPVAGWGVGMFTRALADRTPGQPSWAHQPVHNVPLLVFVETGALGLIFLLAVLFGLWRFFVKWWQYSSPDSRICGAVFFGAALCILTVALFDHYLWSLYAGNMLVGVTFGFLLNQAKNLP